MESQDGDAVREQLPEQDIETGPGTEAAAVPGNPEGREGRAGRGDHANDGEHGDEGDGEDPREPQGPRNPISAAALEDPDADPRLDPDLGSDPHPDLDPGLDAGPDSGLDPDADPESAESAEGSADSARPVERSGVPRPRSAAGWVLYPFAFCWRLLFPKKPRPFLVELPFLVVFALVLAFLIKTFLVQAFFIPSGSMQNTLAIGDRVLVNRAEVWIGDQPARGDVVVFRDPGDWLGDEGQSTSSNWLSSALTFVGVLPQNDGDLIKRVIGVGGDRVICCNAQDEITVNGVPLNESGYLFPGDSPDSAPAGVDPHFNIVVPKGYLWVMGDHRSVSEDSRAHIATGTEFVPVGNVVGKADVIVWPVSQWSTLPVPATFRQAGLAALSAPGGTPAAALTLALPVTAVRRRRKLRASRAGADAGSDLGAGAGAGANEGGGRRTRRFTSVLRRPGR